ncbi:zinc finger domain-containing protein [Ophiocordyceps sinensis CO18]|nr:zinc finger domain-containing protein [Ophiocordyceps sinensis CO18]
MPERDLRALVIKTAIAALQGVIETAVGEGRTRRGRGRGGRPRCFRCGRGGHLARTCREPRCRAGHPDANARGDPDIAHPDANAPGDPDVAHPDAPDVAHPDANAPGDPDHPDAPDVAHLDANAPAAQGTQDAAHTPQTPVTQTPQTSGTQTPTPQELANALGALDVVYLDANVLAA